MRDKLEKNYCKELERINKTDLIPIREKAIMYSKLNILEKVK